MSAQQSGRSLREVLATNPDLRHNMQKAAALAAYNVVRDAGITITPADIADAQSDIAAMTLPPGAVKMDTVSDIANVATTVVTIASFF